MKKNRTMINYVLLFEDVDFPEEFTESDLTSANIEDVMLALKERGLGNLYRIEMNDEDRAPWISVVKHFRDRASTTVSVNIFTDNELFGIDELYQVLPNVSDDNISDDYETRGFNTICKRRSQQVTCGSCANTGERRGHKGYVKS